MKTVGEYGIRQVGYFPITVIYCTKQKEFWNNINMVLRPVVIVDATGSFVKAVNIEGNKSGYICVYQMVTSIEEYP